MRKIVVEIILTGEDEESYADVCTDLLLEDVLVHDTRPGPLFPANVLSDTGWPSVDADKTCCVCGQKENLREDYSLGRRCWRCNKPGCQVF